MRNKLFNLILGMFLIVLLGGSVLAFSTYVSNPVSYFNGSVGIGTNSPDGELHVDQPSGNTIARITSRLGTTGDIVKLFIGYWDGTSVYQGLEIYRKNGDSAVYFNNTQGGNLIFENSNVGIGTTTPGTKLQVNGNITIGSSITIPAQLELQDIFTPGGKNLVIGDDTFFSDIDKSNIVGLYGIADPSKGGLQLGNNSTSTIFGDNGKIGIGTYTPTSTLNVVGTVNITNDTYIAENMFINKNFVGIGITAQSSNFQIGTTTGRAFSITDTGAGSNTYFRFEADTAVAVNNAAYADGSWTGGGADYAEWFLSEEKIPSSSLVGLNIETGKVRIWRVGDPIIGVQSINPGFVGNNLKAENNEKDMINGGYVLVGLVGQLVIDSKNIYDNKGKVYTSDGQFVGYRLSDDKVFIK